MENFEEVKQEETLPPQSPPALQPAPSPTSQPSSKKNHLLIGVIVAIVIVVVGAGILVLLSKTETRPTTPEAKEPETLPVDPTVNWQTYRNEEFGFEARYPKDWEILNEFRDPGVVIIPFVETLKVRETEQVIQRIGFTVKIYESISMLPGYGKDSQTFVEAVSQTFWLPGQEKLKGEIQEEITFGANGNQGILVKKFKELGAIKLITRIFADRNGLIYEMESWVPGASTAHLPGSYDYDKVFDQILSTFRFIEGKNTTSPESLDVGVNRIGSIKVERIEPTLVHEIDPEQEVTILDGIDSKISLKQEIFYPDPEDLDYSYEAHQLYYGEEKVGAEFVTYSLNTIDAFTFEFNNNKYLLIADYNTGISSNYTASLYFYRLDKAGPHMITKQCCDGSADIFAQNFIILGVDELLLISNLDTYVSLRSASHSYSLYSIKDQIVDSLGTDTCESSIGDLPVEENLEYFCERSSAILLFEKDESLHIEVRNGRKDSASQYYIVSADGEFVDVTEQFID